MRGVHINEINGWCEVQNHPAGSGEWLPQQSPLTPDYGHLEEHYLPYHAHSPKKLKLRAFIYNFMHFAIKILSVSLDITLFPW